MQFDRCSEVLNQRFAVLEPRAGRGRLEDRLGLRGASIRFAAASDARRTPGKLASAAL
jgi:hypothetical protein